MKSSKHQWVFLIGRVPYHYLCWTFFLSFFFVLWQKISARFRAISSISKKQLTILVQRVSNWSLKSIIQNQKKILIFRVEQVNDQSVVHSNLQNIVSDFVILITCWSLLRSLCSKLRLDFNLKISKIGIKPGIKRLDLEAKFHEMVKKRTVLKEKYSRWVGFWTWHFSTRTNGEKI